MRYNFNRIFFSKTVVYTSGWNFIAHCDLCLLYLVVRGAQQITVHRFGHPPPKHSYILKYGKVIYKGNEKNLTWKIT